VNPGGDAQLNFESFQSLSIGGGDYMAESTQQWADTLTVTLSSKIGAK